MDESYSFPSGTIYLFSWRLFYSAPLCPLIPGAGQNNVLSFHRNTQSQTILENSVVIEVLHLQPYV